MSFTEKLIVCTFVIVLWVLIASPAANAQESTGKTYTSAEVVEIVKKDRESVLKSIVKWCIRDGAFGLELDGSYQFRIDCTVRQIKDGLK